MEEVTFKLTIRGSEAFQGDRGFAGRGTEDKPVPRLRTEKILLSPGRSFLEHGMCGGQLEEHGAPPPRVSAPTYAPRVWGVGVGVEEGRALPGDCNTAPSDTTSR